MKPDFGWDLPAGAKNDPNAPYNQPEYDIAIDCIWFESDYGIYVHARVNGIGIETWIDGDVFEKKIEKHIASMKWHRLCCEHDTLMIWAGETDDNKECIVEFIYREYGSQDIRVIAIDMQREIDEELMRKWEKRMEDERDC